MWWSSRKQNTATPPPGTRVYAIGDIHGCLSRLKALQQKILNDRDKAPESRFVLVYVGDYVDRGPDSREVIDPDITRMSVNYYLMDFDENPSGCVSRNLRWCYRFAVSQIGTAGQEPVERTLRSARTPKELRIPVPVPTMLFDNTTPLIDSLSDPDSIISDDGLILDQFEAFVSLFCAEKATGARREEKMIEVLRLLRGDWRKVEIAGEWLTRGWAVSMNSAKVQVAYALDDLRSAWGAFASQSVGEGSTPE